ncbi:hypothetical protein BaRGS_00015175 [Batillaria attramentaria]|uniref:Uncharacterized protein n=1 Tax=Batillaria attramentaria TaxID=370345 RepID=A0ABD0L2V9_9CAEN
MASVTRQPYAPTPRPYTPRHHQTSFRFTRLAIQASPVCNQWSQELLLSTKPFPTKRPEIASLALIDPRASFAEEGWWRIEPRKKRLRLSPLLCHSNTFRCRAH